MAMLPRHLSSSAVKMWRVGARSLPVDIAEALATEIEQRSRAGLMLVEELRLYANTARLAEIEVDNALRRRFSRD